jgi:phosphatidate cytidylyltransferase
VSNLGVRTITGVIGAAILLGGIFYSEQTFLLLLLFITSMALMEFYKIADEGGAKVQRLFGLAINFIVFLPVLIRLVFQMEFNILPLIIILPFIIFIRELYLKNPQPLFNIGATLLGIIYITLSLFCFYLFSFFGAGDGYQYGCIIGYLFILWANDIGAYFAGRFLGKHKLFERISPRKTWEGFFGGIIFALLIAYCVSIFFKNFSLPEWMIIAVIIIITGTLGDLIESMFKRSVHIKDSGGAIPGHGGFLDRFDGLFISAPFVFSYFLIVRQAA